MQKFLCDPAGKILPRLSQSSARFILLFQAVRAETTSHVSLNAFSVEPAMADNMR